MVRTRTIPFDRDITEVLTVDDVGQAPFEAAQGFLVGVAFGAFTEVVGTPSGMLTGLGDRHAVQGESELAITGA
jgi:hypothetical protein